MPMAVFNRKSSFATVAKFFNMIYALRVSEELKARLVILKNFTIVAK